MTIQPLKFERQFASLKASLHDITVGDFRLLSLMAFWPQLRPLLGNRLFDSHVEEFAAGLTANCSPDDLEDLLPVELEQMYSVLSALKAVADRFSFWDDIAHAETVV